MAGVPVSLLPRSLLKRHNGSNLVLKAFKRTMAGEYSRELGAGVEAVVADGGDLCQLRSTLHLFSVLFLEAGDQLLHVELRLLDCLFVFRINAGTP